MQIRRPSFGRVGAIASGLLPVPRIGRRLRSAGRVPFVLARDTSAQVTAGSLVSVSARLPAAVEVRPYQHRDRAAIRRLCADAGFLAGPVERVLPDRELFADLHTNAYLNRQPQWAQVAVEDRRLLGYLLGATADDFGLWLVASGARASLRLGRRLHAGCYAGHPHAAAYIEWLFERSLREQPRHPRRSAHMHFNMVPGARGRGVAHALWRSFERQLRAYHIPSYYGVLMSWEGHRPERVYQRYGLEVFDRRPCSLLPELVPQPAELVCVWRRL